MFNAYVLFFLCALTGSALALWTLLRAHAHEVIAILRGEPLFDGIAPHRSRFVRFRSGRRPAFQPVRFSICRL